MELPTTVEYEYEPKAQKSPAVIPPELPPLAQDDFIEAFGTCASSCVRSWLWFHTCRQVEAERRYIERIPKRNMMFSIGKRTQEDAWGLETRRRVSAVRVIIYHVSILTAPIVFWAWWQHRYPTDLQNASVPFMAAMALLSLFWAVVGLLPVLDERS